MNMAAVKKWTTFQHYKDRSPPWIKLQKELLDDFDFARLPLASKALAPLMWLLASESMDGSVSVDPEFIAFRLRWPVEDVRAGLTPLIDKGFLILASGVLAPCLQDACLEAEAERETEVEVETEKRGAKAPALTLPDWLPESTWADWHTFRNQRKGWTHKARELSLRTLTKLHAKGHDPTAVIEKSIENGWTGLFELKTDTGNAHANHQPSHKLSAVERVEQAILERRAKESDDDQDAALVRLGYG